MRIPGRGKIVDVRRFSMATAGLVALAVLVTACGTSAHSIDRPRSLPTSTIPSASTTTTTVVATTTTTTTPPPANFRSVQWADISVPGAVCQATAPIELNQGNATIPTPAGVNAGTPQVYITEWSLVQYGDLYGTDQPDIAALDVWCSNTGGTADGQLQDSWVIFADTTGTLQTLVTLTPQQPSVADSHVPTLNPDPGGIVIQPGKITVEQAWYGPNDGTCCPTGQATTVWTFAGGRFTPSTTIQAYPKGWRFQGVTATTW
jgi:hypothetical protein